jgi:ABC-type nitrate/sulfonate/bicarbonate transport system permease component
MAVTGSVEPTVVSQGTAARRQVVRTERIGTRNSLRLISVVLMLVIWQIISYFVKPLFLPSPISVAKSFASLTAHGGLLSATWESLEVFLMGFVIAAVIGVALGIVFGLTPKIRDLSDVALTIFWATPTVALLPLLVIWFGLTTKTQVFIVFLSTFFPVVMETTVAVEHVDPALVRVARAFGATQRERISHIILPYSIPYIVSGLRIAVGRAVIGVVVAELFTSATGLGAKMTYYSNFFQTANYFAALVMFVIFSLVLTELISLLERRYKTARGVA